MPARFRLFYLRNPVAASVESLRAALFGRADVPWPELSTAVGLSLLLSLSGALYFRRTERSFADLV